MTIACAPTPAPPNKQNLSPQPVIKLLTPAVRDLGRLKAGTSIDERFKFVNASTRTIRFSPTVVTNCGCSAAWLSQTVLAPAQTGSIRLTAHVPTGNGSQILRATLNLEDSAGPPIDFSLRYEILLPWAVRPSELRFVGTPGTNKEAALSVLKLSDAALEVFSVETTTPNLTARLKAQDSRRATVAATCKLPAKPGQHIAELLVCTNDDKRPSIRIPVVMNVVAKFRAYPNPLLIYAATEHETAKASCAVESDIPFRITAVSCAHTDVTALPGTPFSELTHRHVIAVGIAANHLSTGGWRRYPRQSRADRRSSA